jgi:hydroxyethylthiazole kinase-like uncharacterized protein yjeF
MAQFLPEALYTAGQSRQLDRLAMDEHRLGGGVLMERAGEAAYALMRHQWPRSNRIAVVCGPGNNGGDGYVLARLGRGDGLEVRLLALGDLSNQGEDAVAARNSFEAAGGVISPFAAGSLSGCDVIVDAIFGTGLERQVAGEWAEAIDAINRSGVPVLALDIPSGLHADTGVALGMAVRAKITISFIALKAGMLTADGPDYCGKLKFNPLAVPDEVYRKVDSYAERITPGNLARLFPRRPRNTHKGKNGRVLVIGGGPGMPGAARMTGEAALYTGAGLVTVATHPDHVLAVNASRPELIVHGIDSASQLATLVGQADTVAIGPGLGRSSWARELLAVVLESSVAKVVDADALNLIAIEPCKDERWILTPHPGEAATLLGKSVQDIQQNRFACVSDMVARFGGVCVLKGAGTIVGSTDKRFVCDRGKPALATAGTGDLLTGTIASFVAQGLDTTDAARAGVWAHAIAADLVARNGERGWLASDFLPLMRDAVHVLETENDDSRET